MLIHIHTIVVTPFAQNCRLIVDQKTKQGVVVDPGGEIERILFAIKKNDVLIKSVILTHAHLDHAGGVMSLLKSLTEEFQLTPLLYGHRFETAMRARVSEQAVLFGLSPKEYQNVREPDVYLEDDDVIEIGTLRAKILFTPGHSPGHISLFFEKNIVTCVESNQDAMQTIEAPVLIAGDTLFAGSIGRTDLPSSDHQTLIRSIRDKIFTLPEQTVVMPGHGENTSVKIEKLTNPFLC